MESQPTSTTSAQPSTVEFQEYIIQSDDTGVWRKCPYCDQKIWDGAHNKTASGFLFHLNTKTAPHSSNRKWKEKFEKGSWHLGSH